LSDRFVVASCAATFGIFNNGPAHRLEEAGCEVRINPYGRPLDSAEIVWHAQDADAIILGNDHLDAATIDRLPHLRLIARHGAGFDAIDFDEASRRGITITNTPGANSEETADLTFALILDLARMVTQAVNQLRGGVWNKIPGRSLYGKTIGIIGVGAIGTAVARRAMGFGMDILGNDIVQREEASRYGLLYTSLNDLLDASDVVTIHAPLTSATRNLLGAKEFRRMKEGALLVNTARADIVRTSALEKALLSGSLGGYAVDVYEHEPPSLGKVWEMPNVLTTPHIGSATFEANQRMGDSVVDNILAFKEGRVPPNRVVAADRVRFS
jgi:phosphoglycerate dehydrogenase-like enzyme